MHIEETAPPPDLIKDIVIVTASSLTILKTLYDFYKATKKKNSTSKIVILTPDGEDIDLEAYNIDELELKIKSKIKRKEP